MIHIYTGNGKGKTTSAFGLALRAVGQNLRVIIFQFLKPKILIAGEERSVKKIKGICFVKFDHTHPMFSSTASLPKLKKAIKRDFGIAKKEILSGKYDMVVLDEIINVVDQSFINQRTFLSLLKLKPNKTELILTGRGDISQIEEYADYVTIMVDKKHPYKNGKKARKGIEF